MKTLKVNRDGSAVVSTRGYRRIVSQPDGRILVEFVRVAHAEKIVANYNWCFPDGEKWAEAIDYREAAKIDAVKRAKNRSQILKVARV